MRRKHRSTKKRRKFRLHLERLESRQLLAAPGDVIINEIHYNPGPLSDPDAEFVELYNPGTAAVDLSGMSFAGFTLTIPNGVSLAAGEYGIVSPSIAIAEAEYGVTPIAEFEAGGISGGGETIQLIDSDGSTVIDEVTYDDVAPWPGAPDGNGPSLELINPSFDNSVPISWLASDPDPTPAAENSVFAEVLPPAITNITLNPTQPLPNQSFTISADIADAASATLTYKVMFETDVTVPMTNVGGDTWQATVPGQDAGDLVRYRIDTIDASAPVAGDTINYLGTVVAATDIVDNTLPVFNWFVEPELFDELVNELFLTNTYIPTVVAYGDQVIDNAEVRVRGSASRFKPKKNFKFEMPDGYLLDAGPFALNPADEFAIQTDFSDWTFTGAAVSWEVWNEASETEASSFFMRVEQNADFFGLYRFQDLYDGTWRTANGLEDSEFYEAEGGWTETPGFDKKTPKDEDFTLIEQVQTELQTPASAAKTGWLYDNIDVPSMVNYMAISALMRHGDQFSQNFYTYRDASTERWTQLPWDLDQTWKVYEARCATDDMTTLECVDAGLTNAIWEVPEFRDMYWRRLQTLIDTYLDPNDLEDRRVELMNTIGTTNSGLEVAAWGRSDIVTSTGQAEDWNDAIQARRDIFAGEPRLPGSALADPQIVINEIHYNPAGDDAEFLELYNPGTEAVDLSGWSVDGNGLVIPMGTVILPRDYVVFTDIDLQFRAQSPGDIFVGAQYPGGLSGGGETITLLDANGVIKDQVTYDDALPWPIAPDGDGPSLALINPALDNADPANWLASVAVNGTPGAQNDVFVAGPNTAPTVTNPVEQDTLIGTPVSLAVAATDDDGDDLSFTAVGLPDGLTIGSASGVIVGTTQLPGTSIVTVTVSDGTETTEVSFDWTVFITPPPCVLPDTLYEAEDGSLIGVFEIGSDPNASGGQFVGAPAGSGSASGPGGNFVEFCFTVETAGNFTLDAIVDGPDGSSDSFFVTVDGVPTNGYLWDLAPGWIDDQVSDRNSADPVVLALAAGDHSVQVHLRESGARLDAIRLNTLPSDPDPTPALPGTIVEAESGALTGRFAIGADATASGGQFVSVPSGPGASGPAADYVSFVFDVQTAGDYTIDAVVDGPDFVSDSFFVTIDDQPAAGFLWDLPAGWQADQVSDRNGADPVVATLDVGLHTVRVHLRETGSRLDTISLIAVETDPDPVPALPGTIVEAESGVLTGRFAVGADAAASGGQFVSVPSGSGASAPANDFVSFVFDVQTAGDYTIDAVVDGPDFVSDSFFVTIDDQPAAGYLWDIPAGWQADQVSDRNGADPVVATLDVGLHTVRVHLRETGSRLDTISLIAVEADPDPVPALPGTIVEAETGSLTGRFAVGADPAASGGQYVAVPSGSGASAPGNDYVSFLFDVQTAGDFTIDAVVNGPNGGANSFFVTVDDQPSAGYLWDIPLGWNADQVKDRGGSDPVVLSLDVGIHTVQIHLREVGAQLDTISLVPTS